MKMENFLYPRESARLITQLSKNVKIHKKGIEKAACLIFHSLLDGSITENDWDAQEMHPKFGGKKAVDWCFFVSTVNFCFWVSPKDVNKYTVTYKGKVWSGYFALCACVNRALDNGIPLIEPSFYANLTQKQASEIFVGDSGVMIPLLNDRISALHQAGKTLVEKFNGSFYNCLESADCSAKKLLGLIVDYFDSYRDMTVYCGNNVSFLKRAQILIADVHGCLKGESPAAFTDIDVLTMFADYRVPQVLSYMGALQYSNELKQALENGVTVTYDDKSRSVSEEVECEIRGCSIEACEQIVQTTRDLIEKSTEKGTINRDVNAILVDNFLWCYRRRNAKEIEKFIPFHRVRTIFY